MNNIYVGRLARSVNEAKLRALFEPFGDITSLRVIKDRMTGDPRCAFVQFTNDDSGQQAIEQLNGTVLEGRNIIVSVARPQEPRTNGGGGGNGGNGGGGFRSQGPRPPRFNRF